MSKVFRKRQIRDARQMRNGPNDTDSRGTTLGSYILVYCERISTGKTECSVPFILFGFTQCTATVLGPSGPHSFRLSYVKPCHPPPTIYLQKSKAIQKTHPQEYHRCRSTHNQDPHTTPSQTPLPQPSSSETAKIPSEQSPSPSIFPSSSSSTALTEKTPPSLIPFPSLPHHHMKCSVSPYDPYGQTYSFFGEADAWQMQTVSTKESCSIPRFVRQTSSPIRRFTRSMSSITGPHLRGYWQHSVQPQIRGGDKKRRIFTSKT